MPAGDVDDRKPAVTQSDWPIAVNPLVVRPPVNDAIAHCFDDERVGIAVKREIQVAGDAAHERCRIRWGTAARQWAIKRLSSTESICQARLECIQERRHMNLPRTPEPKILSAAEEAAEYLAMDHSEVNRRFVDELLSGPVGPRVIDLGSGPALIPIELCRRDETVEVIAVDGDVEMLELAKVEIDMAGMLDRITLHHADATGMDEYEDGMADTVISNSLIHHLDDPRIGLETAIRLLAPGGRLFLRDLYRPPTESEVESLVEQYAGEENANAQQLFRQSLHASLTLAEIRHLAGGLGIAEQHVQMSSDRHWTIDWVAPT